MGFGVGLVSELLGSLWVCVSRMEFFICAGAVKGGKRWNG